MVDATGTAELSRVEGGGKIGVALGCAAVGVGVGLLTVGWGGGIAFGVCVGVMY